jgi:phosphoenolpyruvate-protein phosphotransferase (PTS system enzyme I)
VPDHPTPEEAAFELRTYKGTGVSPGIAIGRGVIIESRIGSIYRVPLKDEEIEREVSRFRQAVEKTRADLLELREKVSRSMGEEYGSIFDAHAMIVSDPSFADKITQKIEFEKINAEWAVAEIEDELLARFSSFENEYLRERGEDIADVGASLLKNLQGIAHHDLSEIESDVVILADDITPADAVHFNRRPIVGFATESGGRTSHTSIIAKSLFMPAVIGVPRLTELIDSDELVIIDGYEGTIHVNPSPAMVEEYRSRETRRQEYEERLLETRELQAATRDGHELTLQANIELTGEIGDAIRYGAQGIGLYRSEFLYISKSPDLPSEEEHLQVYRELVESVAPFHAVIRTFDLGGKKLAREVMGSEEDNPVLGLRGLRLCMKHRDMFRTQLRALLRASVYGNMKIMFPLVSSLQEVRQAKSLLRDVKTELDREGLAYDPDVPLGIMIEVPAAAVMADILATESDFFSIGTNDLIQYALAIDRGNEHVAYLYEPLHPAILRMVKWVLDAGKAAGIPVSMCGEMAGEPLYAPILVGLGLDIFSMNPSSIPLVKNLLRAVRLRDCRRIAEQALKKKTAQEVEELLIEQVAMKIPENLSSVLSRSK